MPKLLILCNYPHGVAPGQRFRFDQYLGILRQAAIEATVQPFFDETTWKILYEPGHFLQKLCAVLRGFVRRFKLIFQATQFDYVFIHLEAAPLGPPVIEFVFFSLGCKVIYDIDDAIFMPRTSRPTRG